MKKYIYNIQHFKILTHYYIFLDILFKTLKRIDRIAPYVNFNCFLTFSELTSTMIRSLLSHIFKTYYYICIQP